jgi:uncharacterized membrane protein required for colicin V production
VRGVKREVVLLEWITRFNWVDVLVIVVLVRGIYVGSQRGFFGEFFYILGISTTIIFGIHFYSIGANFMNKYLFIPLNISNLLGFLFITFCLYLTFKFIYRLLQKIIKIEVFPAINKIGGLLLGFCKGFVISVLLLLIMLLIPIGYITDSVKAKSVFGPFFVDKGISLYKRVVAVISVVEPRDLTQLLEGAKPLNLNIFKFKKRDRLDEILQ